MAPTQPVYDPTNPTGYWDWPATGESDAGNPVASLNRPRTTARRGAASATCRPSTACRSSRRSRPTSTSATTSPRPTRKTSTRATSPARRWQGHGYLSFDNSQTRSNEVAETYLNYAAPLNVRARHHRRHRRLLVHAVARPSTRPSRRPASRATSLGINGVPTAANVSNSNSVVDYKLISFFGRVNYNLNDRYLVAASVRRDGSSRFGPGNQWGTLPLGVAGLAHLAGAVPERLAGALGPQDPGVVGEDRQPGVRGLPAVPGVYVQQRPGAVSNSTASTSPPSAPARWTRTSTGRPPTRTTSALDFGFLDQRISGSFDWYTKKTTDLIFTVPVAAGTNFSNHVDDQHRHHAEPGRGAQPQRRACSRSAATAWAGPPTSPSATTRTSCSASTPIAASP